jgi:hypothetical protein
MQALEKFFRERVTTHLPAVTNLEMWAEHFLDGSYALAART